MRIDIYTKSIEKTNNNVFNKFNLYDSCFYTKNKNISTQHIHIQLNSLNKYLNKNLYTASIQILLIAKQLQNITISQTFYIGFVNS